MSRAVRFTRYGGPEVLEVVEVDEPHPGAGQVRVAVRAAGLNPFDSKVRRGTVPSLTAPRGQGSEFSGVIDELGEGVTTLAVGDEVLGWASSCQADFVLARATSVAPKPAELDWETAGGLGLVGNTAVRASAAVRLDADDTVLVSGVTGGVGLLSAQFARRSGATVIGTAREAHHEFLRRLGIIPVAYGQDLGEALKAVAPHGITAVLDSVGSSIVELALAMGVPADKINSVAIDDGSATYGISTVGGGGKTAAELAELARLAAAGELVLPIRASFPLARVRDAYQELEGGHGLGKIVLVP
ncbi:NADP-dependent oxidoreductase [Parafrigoribacterium mesophilum]|uniref:NADP-dependent oxidoreductase n=1 Tax=Parafrigoribacterium mesophilum TaxID=433646 RepID=UPI0031FBE8DE